MRSEDELDALLTVMAQGRPSRAPVNPVNPISDEVAPLLEAARRLDSLRDAAPSAAFSDALEARLLARMAQRAPAATSAPQRAAPQMRRRRYIAFAPRAAWTAIAAALILTIALGVLTAQAAPGSPLYGVRQLTQKVVAGSTSASDAAAALKQAQADLALYTSSIAQGDTRAALAALAKLRADDARATQTIAQMRDAAARQQAQAQLDSFHQQAAQALLASLSALDWQARAQVTDALRAWGATQLTVSHARIVADTAHSPKPQAANAGETVLAQISGAGFTSGAVVLVNGQPVGTVLALTPTQLIARIPAISLADMPGGGALTLGVEAPDGTVAITTQIARDDGAPSHAATPGDGHSTDQGGAPAAGAQPTSTPVATSTRSPHPDATPTASPTH